MLDRSWRRQRKVKARLGECWQRPKGVHQTTHMRLMNIIWTSEEQRENALGQYLAVMLRRDPTLRDDPLLA